MFYLYVRELSKAENTKNCKFCLPEDLKLSLLLVI